MSYRKINVNGTVYEYTIGKKFTKIKNFGIFENSRLWYVRLKDNV